VADFDASVPSIARVYDYFLGGEDNVAADRELADKMIALYPPIPQMVRENKRFLQRAVAWAAGQGIRQFVDLGSGIPTSPNTHETAQAVSDSARVVYVDNDPVVVSHLTSLTAERIPGVAAISGDVRFPDAILAASPLRELIDAGEPACVVMGCLLHFLDPSSARELVRGYTARLARGSYLVISVARAEGELGEQASSTYNAPANLSSYNPSPADVESFFSGLELVPPGIGQVEEWRPGLTELPRSPARAGQILVGVGRIA
jgi:O-methyltransferase involved in polyketide biosynthesis